MKHGSNFFLDLLIEDQRPKEARPKKQIQIPYDQLIFGIALIILGLHLL